MAGDLRVGGRNRSLLCVAHGSAIGADLAASRARGPPHDSDDCLLPKRPPHLEQDRGLRDARHAHFVYHLRHYPARIGPREPREGEPGADSHRFDGALGCEYSDFLGLVLANRCRGPHERDMRSEHRCGAFFFPQMSMDPELLDAGDRKWVPGFVDYLFLAFNTSTALSPCDTAPLSRWAKFLMMVQASISLTIIVLVAARAVNIL